MIPEPIIIEEQATSKYIESISSIPNISMSLGIYLLIRYYISMDIPKKSNIFISTTNPGDYVEIVNNRETRQFKRSPYGKRWHKMSFEGHIYLAKSDLTGTDYRVLHMLLPSIQDGSIVYINQTHLAQDLGMKPNNVCRSIQRLIDLKIIERMNLKMTGRVYRLNPRIGWYGADNGDHVKAIKDWDAAQSMVQ